MVEVVPSPVAQLPDRLRRMSVRVERPRDKELLYAAAARIVELEIRLGVRHYNKLKLSDVDVDGKQITFAQAVEMYGVEGLTVDNASTRYHARGWSLVEALSTPVRKRGDPSRVKRVQTLTLRKKDNATGTDNSSS